MSQLIQDTDFLKQSFVDKDTLAKEYENCTFEQCDFSQAELSSVDFIDCKFSGCNLSLAKLNNTGFKSCEFTDCKMTGLDFHPCNDFLFAVSFKACYLDYSSFFKKKMKKSIFTDCSMKETDFTEVDLSGARLDNCNLDQAVFVRTNLEKADFRTAYNYLFDPAQNKMKGAKFSLNGLPGLLTEFGIVVE